MIERFSAKYTACQTSVNQRSWVAHSFATISTIPCEDHAFELSLGVHRIRADNGIDFDVGFARDAPESQSGIGLTFLQEGVRT